MPDPQHLLQRLDAITRSLENSGQALALIGLGSTGAGQARLDRYSDLDFFVIVRPGAKTRFLEDLGWLEAIHPVAYRFQNTADGYKLLYTDGIFCEFAVFEPDQLAQIPYQAGRVIWRHPRATLQIPESNLTPEAPQARPVEWLLGEALTNLYIGLQREQRGEKLSAARFIQGHSLDRVLELAAQIEQEHPVEADPFTNERRFEQRFPVLARRLPAFNPGYAHNTDAAAAILAFLKTHFSLDPAMDQALQALIAEAQPGPPPEKDEK